MKAKGGLINVKLVTLALISSFFTIMFIAAGCEKGEENETKISRNNETESHNNGQNCMNCHKSGGPGEGRFNVAGSVYDSLFTSPKANGYIKLYTAANGGGTLKYTIEVDAKGNFYTTESIDFGSGLWPSVEGASGNKRYMSDVVITGACNSCHNVSTDKL